MQYLFHTLPLAMKRSERIGEKGLRFVFFVLGVAHPYGAHAFKRA